MRSSRLLILTVFLLFAAFSLTVKATERVWTGSGGDSNWFNSANWDPTDYPQPGDSVVISNSASVSLSNDTAMLDSFTITNATLMFTNWYTEVKATNVTIQADGKVTLPAAFAFTNTVMSNRVHIVCTNLTIETGGSINADYKGYMIAQGPGKGNQYDSNNNSGGGHGGRGGDESSGTGGITYDSANAPVQPGSGGGRWTSSPINTNGCGGGVVRIEAANVTINGTITANGSMGNPYDGGGSGGAIYITCNTFGGTGGVVRVNGGDGGVYYGGGGGGGGRIAVEYQSIAGEPSVLFSAAAGPLYTAYAGGMGTLWLSDTVLVSADRLADFDNVRLIIPGFTSWNVNSLTVSNVVCMGESGFSLTVTNGLVVESGGWLTLGAVAQSSYQVLGVTGQATNPVVNIGENIVLNGGALSLGGLDQESRTIVDVGGNVTLTNGSGLYVYSGPTNSVETNGGLVTITGDVWIASNSWLYTYSQSTNGGSLLFKCNDFVVSEGGGINADGTGYRSDTTAYGPGAGVSSGSRGGGAGYGGKGGRGENASATGGSTYGLTNAPVQPGSGGGYGYASGPGNAWGGGSIRFDASDVIINGTLSANGQDASGYGGGGSGGGILITCNSFSGGTAAVICANGGNGAPSGGGGGGGRIAIGINLSSDVRSQLQAGQDVSGLSTYTNHGSYAGAMTVTEGTGAFSPYAEGGTIVFMTTNTTLTIVGNPGDYGIPGPQGYGTRGYTDESIWITNSVSSPADEANGVRHACIGWNLVNADDTPVDSDAGFQAVFQLITNRVLTWNWTNEYELTVSGGSTNGTVSTNLSGWYTNGVEVSGISATGSVGYAFSQWTGDVPLGSETNNPLTVTMDQVRTITAHFYSLSGETKTWTGNGNWTIVTNWSPAGMPGPYDDAIIQSGSVILSEPMEIGSLTVSNSATLIFTNWTTTLTASNITVRNGGTMTLPGSFTESQMSNRVYIVCTNFTLENSGIINADEKGYAADNGPGKGEPGAAVSGGGGYGGRGGRGSAASAVGGSTYGSTNAPIDPGSGGGYADFGGDGGGAVRIEATGNVIVNGTITANGGNTGYTLPGGGSGGSIFITCGGMFSGTNGVLQANGGNFGGSGGGGGGGRIAVDYGSVSESNGVRFSASPGTGWGDSQSEEQWWRWVAGMGTLYLPDTSLLSETLNQFVDVRLIIPGFTSWDVAGLTVNTGVVALADGDFRLKVTNDLVIESGGSLSLGARALKGWVNEGVAWQATNSLSVGGSVILNGGTLSLGGVAQGSKTVVDVEENLTLTNGGNLYVYSGITNGVEDYGALVTVTGRVSISSSSWIYPYSNPTNGGSVLFRIKDALIISMDGGINADFYGYMEGYGPGKGVSGYGGGGYGGQGGGAGGGGTYGSTNAPIDPGSPGMEDVPSPGRAGGGLVRIEVDGDVTVDGTITANGAGDGPSGAGGAGGGIYIMCGTFSGSTNGILRANGGDGVGGSAGGGGGGRIAVWYKVPESRRAGILDGSDMRRVSIITNASDYSEFSGTVFVMNGTGSGGNGQPGTIVFLTVTPASGTVFMMQ